MEFVEVRTRVLQDHEDLRLLLNAVEDLALRARAGGTSVIPQLRERGEALAYRLRDHLALEDEHLVPLVNAERGPEAVDQLAAEHREQRLVIDFVVERLQDETRPTRLMVREIATFAELLREDMAHEEEELLQPRSADRAVASS
ncbi:MAG: hemerythrin domain-containing protein [Proteobacteria bacterium]|nr:hemerythrin domain-containing protein [Pseudomonadota bacterium]